MKDQHDTSTAELLPLKRPRGRPRTGNAMTPAERQAKYYAKQVKLAENTVTLTINEDDVKALKLALVRAEMDYGLSKAQKEALARIESALYRVAPGL